jgi:hypothetical protein
MPIHTQNGWVHYAGQIAAWRTQAANNYTTSLVNLNTLIWHPAVAHVINGVNVNVHMGTDEIHPRDKMRGLRRAIERIAAARPLLAFPNLEVYITNHTSGAVASPMGVRPQLQTVGMHVNGAGVNHATIVLTGSSIQSNPLQTEHTPRAPGLRCRGRLFYAAQGTRRMRGIPDYWYETRRARKRSNLVAAVTIHEMGHIFHQLNHPARFWPLNCAPADFNMAPNRKINISMYANSSLCEFVAEYFTARILGCTIAAGLVPINIDYNALGGAGAW